MIAPSCLPYRLCQPSGWKSELLDEISPTPFGESINPELEQAGYVVDVIAKSDEEITLEIGSLEEPEERLSMLFNLVGGRDLDVRGWRKDAHVGELSDSVIDFLL